MKKILINIPIILFLMIANIEHLYANPINLGADTVLTCGDTILLNAGVGYTTYLWSDGSTNQQLSVTDTGTYWVAGTDGGGIIWRDTIYIGLSLQSNLVGYYPFDNDFQDYSPTGNHGAATGTYLTTSLINNGAQFNGNTDFVQVQNFNLDNDFTIAAWIKLDSTYATIFAMRDQCPTTYRGFSKATFAIYNHQLHFGVNKTGNNGSQICTGWSNGDRYRTLNAPPIPEDCFTHVAVKVTNNSSEGRTVQFFINGVLQTTDHYFNTNTSSVWGPGRTYKTYIGKPTDYNTNYGSANFSGTYGIIDEVYVYERTLDNCEVAALHAKGMLPPLMTAINNNKTISNTCPIDTFILVDATNNNVCLREWRVNDVLTSSDSVFVFKPNTTGIYNIKLITSDGLCNTDTAYQTITVIQTFDTTYLTTTTCDAIQQGVSQILLQNQYGCDSLVITTTTLNPSDTTYLTAMTCDATQQGVSQILLQNQYGCDSLVITTTTLNPSDTTYLTAMTCDATQQGVSQNLLQNQYGCDSLVITTTTLNPSDTTYLTATTCDPNQQGVSFIILNNQYGCDSLVITTTTLNPSDTTYLTATTCDATQQGVSSIILNNQYGCDSLVITTTTLNPSDTTYLTATTCDPNQQGVSFIILNNQYGCDSLVITTTTLNPSDTTYLTATTCDASQQGVSSIILNNQYGCDSLVITTTTLNPSDTTYLTATTCDPNQQGVSFIILNNQYGCDSLVITTTTLNPSDSTVIDTAICEGEFIDFQGQTFNQEGLYCIDLGNCQMACMNLTVYDLPTVTMPDSISIILGKSIQLNEGGNPNHFYTWLPLEALNCTTCPSPFASPTENTTVSVLVESIEGCEYQDSILINIRINCLKETLELPNTIIPNTANGYFKIMNPEMLENFEYLRIYDRWGELIFETADVYSEWQGDFKGQMVNSGVYTYYLKGRCIGAATDMVLAGTITVLR